MIYAGEQPPPPEVDFFVEQLVAKPEAMAAAMDLITAEPFQAETVVKFLEGTPERREERVDALRVASHFLGSALSGRFKYDRPTEAAMSKDKTLQELIVKHRVTAGMPDRQTEVTRKIRARQFAIFAGRLAASNRTVTIAREARGQHFAA